MVQEPTLTADGEPTRTAIHVGNHVWTLRNPITGCCKNR